MASTKASKPQFTRFTITKDDRVKYKGRCYQLNKAEGEFAVFITLEEDLAEKTQVFSFEELDSLIRLKVVEVDVGYFKTANVIARRCGAKLFELSPDTILRARMMSEFIETELDAEETGEKYPRSDRGIKKFLLKFDAENQAMVGATRGGQPTVSYRDRHLVGPRQFRRLLKRFEVGGMHPTSLMPRYQGRQSSGSTFTVEQQEYFQSFAVMYQTDERKTKKLCYDLMVADNEKRPSKGLEKIKLLSIRSFQRLINDLGDFDTERRRAGDVLRVDRKFSISNKGLQPKFPLQIVEMDEHKVDIVRILIRNGIWAELHPDVKKRIKEKGRPWLSVAMDAYSRSILAMRLLYDDPSGQSALETLAMAVRSKESETALCGTMTVWPQCGTPWAVHTDAGAGYLNAAFQAAVFALTDRHVIPPSKHPHLRGRVERLFRTINQRYISLFSGQTFSNVLLRDNYDSVKHAHMEHEELARLLVRLIVDCYHNTVQKGLMGLTPLQAWYRGSQLEGGIRPPPSDEEYRDIFGIADKRKIGNSGIEILGNHYSSQKLMGLRKADFDAEREVRINPQDLSEISVKHPDHGWFSVPATFEGMKGITVEEWVETVRYIKTQFGKRTKHSRKAVLDTLHQVAAESLESKKRHNVGAPQHTAATIRLLERKETASFSFSQAREIDWGYEDARLDTEANSGASDLASLLPEEGVYERLDTFGPLTNGAEEQERASGPSATPPSEPGDYYVPDSIDDLDDDIPVESTPIETETRKRKDV